MFKVLLQYLISVCLLSAILLHLRMISKEVWETKELEMTSALYMERLESQKSEEEKFERNLKFEEDDDEKCMKENDLTVCNSVRQSNLLSSNEEDEHCKDAERKSCETDVQLSHSTQYILIDLCLMFAYHTASKKSSAETIFFATSALLFWKVSAIPIDCRNAEKRDDDQTIEEHERKSRSVSTKSQFYQGDCQAEWFQNETQCYRLFEEKMNYDSAVQHCDSFGSKLVALRTKKENSFVDKLTSKCSVGYLWTGVQKLCKNCSGTGAYVNWQPGQPGHDGNCVAMVNAGQWMDFDCRYMFAFVCEKGIAKPPYSRQQRLIALLVPIFSCLTVAITFTTALLVSSFRRGNQPFKLSSRYGRTKKPRKIATWDMLDTLRRASMMRTNSKQRPRRTSVPNIEITKANIDKAESEKQSQAQKPREVKFQETEKQLWCKPKISEPFLAPIERRRSSGSGSNSSLYELLVRLNKMDFVPPRDDSQTIELHEFRQERAETEIPIATSEPDAREDCEKLVARNEPSVREPTRQCSFQNMAFRDSVASVETNGNSVVTSLEQRKDAPSKTVVLSQISEPNIAKLNSHSPNCDLEANKNTKTVKVDVHRISKSKASPAANGSAQTSEPKTVSIKGNVVWAYSI